ncbi:MAG: single-stranded DNA-binding protein [Bacilli bacterium]|nr:single-stranded DNA-binding protein [Bacilli bacterium]
MNKVVLVGRLTAKPELRYTPQNTAYTRFSVAVNRTFTNADGKRDADFINVVAWRKQAETISKYFDKGNLIALEGRLQTGSYDDKDGNKRYTVDVALDNFEFVESKAAREQSSSNNYESTPYDYQENSNTPEVNVENDPFAEFGDSVSIDDNFLE